MDITEASKRTNCPDEKQDLMDDHLLHREENEKKVQLKNWVKNVYYYIIINYK